MSQTHVITNPGAPTVASHLHPTPSWSVEDHPLPTRHDEAWRFAPLPRMEPLLTAELTSDNVEWESTIPEGVTLDTISGAAARLLAADTPPLDRVSALAARNASYGRHLDIPADIELAEPVVLTGKGIGGTVSEHLVITVGAHAKATIIVSYCGSCVFAEKTDVIVGDGAQVNIVVVQDWAKGALHGGQRSVVIGRDAQAKLITVSLGGDVIRLQENVRYDGPGGSLEQYGLYFADAGQYIEHRLFVDHNEPHTKSIVDYRGALQGQGAHAVWVGDVLIRKVAEGIETYEANKNLVLTDGCKADSIPNLEIETGQILGAGHSSTTGRFDDEQMFYLMARGIPEVEAKRLVVHGFFVDIVRRIGVPELEAKLIEVIDAELEASIGPASIAIKDSLDGVETTTVSKEK